MGELTMPVDTVRRKVSDRRGLAALVVATHRTIRKVPVTPAEREEASNIERRCGVVERRLQRLQRLHERQEGDVAEIMLPYAFTLDDVERALKIIGATSEEDPGATDDGRIRKMPPPDFGPSR
jgi:hypothetical protein